MNAKPWLGSVSGYEAFQMGYRAWFSPEMEDWNLTRALIAGAWLANFATRRSPVARFWCTKDCDHCGSYRGFAHTLPSSRLLGADPSSARLLVLDGKCSRSDLGKSAPTQKSPVFSGRRLLTVKQGRTIGPEIDRPPF